MAKLFIGGGREAETRANEGWFTNENGGSGTTRQYINSHWREQMIIAGRDAQTCIATAITTALANKCMVNVDLGDIRSHQENFFTINALQVRANDIAYSLNQQGYIDNPNLNITPREVWETAKQKARNIN